MWRLRPTRLISSNRWAAISATCGPRSMALPPLLEPVTERFRQELHELAEVRPDLAAKCADLDHELRKLAAASTRTLTCRFDGLPGPQPFQPHLPLVTEDTWGISPPRKRPIRQMAADFPACQRCQTGMGPFDPKPTATAPPG